MKYYVKGFVTHVSKLRTNIEPCIKSFKKHFSKKSFYTYPLWALEMSYRIYINPKMSIAINLSADGYN